MDKLGATLIQQAYKVTGDGVNTVGFTNMGETLMESFQSKP